METTISELKEYYNRGLDILRRVNDGDDKSIETTMLRHIWTPQDLEDLEKFTKEMQDLGVHLLDSN